MSRKAKAEVLEQLYIREIENLYRAEKQLAEALPRLADAASGADLRHFLRRIWRQTQGHIGRLEVIFSAHDLDVARTRSRLMGNASLIWEAEARLDLDHPEVRDAGLVAVLRRIERDQVCGYGSAVAIAERLGNDEAAELLHFILDEESDAARELSRMDEHLGPHD